MQSSFLKIWVVALWGWQFAFAWISNNDSYSLRYKPSSTTRFALSTTSTDESSSSSLFSNPHHVVVVLGGSGYIGRRICRDLVKEQQICGATTGESIQKVISISRSGKPKLMDDGSGWMDQVLWIAHEFGATKRETAHPQEWTSVFHDYSSSEFTVVACIGNVNPSQEWMELWGLGFDNPRLFQENGLVYDDFLSGISQVKLKRCILLSLDYVGQKCLEGPIDGYVGGKRWAERSFLRALSGNLDDMVVIGLPSFVYGGKRFPVLGKNYRALVESAPAKAYVRFNQALRSLSQTTNEDWVEAMVRHFSVSDCDTPYHQFFLILVLGQLVSSPVHVDTVSKLVRLASIGNVTRAQIPSRKQGFYDTSGMPVEYDDVLFVDGTHEIESIVGDSFAEEDHPTESSMSWNDDHQALWEGALIGKGPYLFPIPVAACFAVFFWAVVTEQFVRERL